MEIYLKPSIPFERNFLKIKFKSCIFDSCFYETVEYYKIKGLLDLCSYAVISLSKELDAGKH